MHKKYAPIIEPINVRQYEFKQSDYEMADKLPFRSIVVLASQVVRVYWYKTLY